MVKLWRRKRDTNRMLIIDEKAIQSTHHPDTNKHDVSPLHKLINEILMPSTTTTTVESKKRRIGSSTQTPVGQGQVDGDHLANSLLKRYKELKDFSRPDSQSKSCCSKELTEIVPEISIALWYKCSGGGGRDANKTMMAMFKKLSCYSWEVKIFMTLAAFAIIYMDSLPMAQNTEPIRCLIDAMVQLTNTIFDVNDSRPENNSTHIPTAVSWTVRSIIACTSHIKCIDELSQLKEKVVEMNTSLVQILDTLLGDTSDLEVSKNLWVLKGLQQKGTHRPDVSPLHKLINEMLMPSTTTTAATAEAKKGNIGSPTQMGQMDRDLLANSLVNRYKDFFRSDSQAKAPIKDFSNCNFKEFAEIVPKISIELWYKCSEGGGRDANKTTMAVFQKLSCYSWEVQIFGTLAAFALIYNGSLPMAMNTKPIRCLIDAMVQFTNTIFDVNKSRPEKISKISTHIDTAVSWTVRSIVACTSHIRYIDDELSKLTEKVIEMNNSVGQLRDTSTRKETDNVESVKPMTRKRKGNDR